MIFYYSPLKSRSSFGKVHFMSFVIQCRTISIETVAGYPDFWYEGDNEAEYSSFEDVLAKSDIVRDWQSGETHTLTAVRVKNVTTGEFTYVSPSKQGYSLTGAFA